MQDDALIRRAAQKDEQAFEQLMLLHQKVSIISATGWQVMRKTRWICHRRYF